MIGCKYIYIPYILHSYNQKVSKLSITPLPINVFCVFFLFIYYFLLVFGRSAEAAVAALPIFYCPYCSNL